MKLNGFKELDDFLSEIAEKLPEKRDKFLMQEAEVLLDAVRKETPTKTGRLKAGWKRTKPQEGSIEVYNNTEYVLDVEYGHRQEPGRFVPAIGKRLKRNFVPGKGMLHKGLLNLKRNFKNDAEKILKGLFK